MHCRFKLNVLVALAFLAAPLSAATVQVQVLPPYSSHLSDYFGQQNNVLVRLYSGPDRIDTVRLACTLTGDNGVRIVSDPSYMPAKPIILSHDNTRQFTGSDLSAYFDPNRVTLTGITKQQLLNTSSLPEGNYTLCVRVLHYFTGVDLTAGNSCSNPFPVTSCEAPMLLYPPNNAEVTPPPVQAMQLSWTKPAGAPANVQYKIKLVEIDSPNRSPADAIASSTTPPLLERTVSNVTTLMLGPADPQLVAGKRYALQITALDPQAKVTFRNNGASQVYSFKYGATQPVIKPKLKYQGLPFNCTLNGQINYTSHDPGVYTTRPLKNKTVKLVLRYSVVNKGGKSGNKPPGYYLISKGLYRSDNGKVLGVCSTDDNGNYRFWFNNTDSMGLVDSNVHIGSGEFKPYYGDVYRMLLVEVDDPYYTTAVHAGPGNGPQYEILVQPGQSKTANWVTALRTYPLTVTTVRQTNDQPLSGMIVYVLRKPGTRPASVPNDEGTAPTPRHKYKNGMEIVAVDTTGPDGTCSKHLTRLVKNINPTDRYYLCAESDPASEKSFMCFEQEYRSPLPGDHAETYDDYYTLYPQLWGWESQKVTLKMIAYAPMIRGYVHRKDDPNKCVPGATVQVYNTDSYPFKLEATTHTSDSGGFQVWNLMPHVKRLVYITCPGFKFVGHIPKINPMDMGQKEVIDPPVLMEPGAKVSGAVVDENGVCVSSRVRIGDLTAVQANGMSGYNINTHKWYTITPAKFECYGLYNVGPQPLIIEPLDQSNFFAAETVMINVTSHTQDVGEVVVHRKLHRITVATKKKIPVGNGIYTTYKYVSLPGAVVTIENLAQPITKTADGTGKASFAFKASGNDFVIRVEGPADNDFIAKTVTVSGVPETINDTTVTISILAGGKVEGQVVSKGQPVAGAVVRLAEQGGTPIEATTAPDGSFVLHNVPLGPHNFTAGKPQSNLIGATKMHHVVPTGTSDSALVFDLAVYNDMDVTNLLGLPIVVDDMTTTGTGPTTVTKISGRFTNLPANPQFTPDGINDLQFHDIEIVPSSQLNAQGIPLARPKNGSVISDNKTVKLKVYDAIKAVAEDPANLVVNEDVPGSGKGVIKAAVRIDAASFAASSIDFPNDRFWLGRPDVSDPANRRKIPVFAAQPQSLSAAPNGLLVTGDNGAALSFTVYGFFAQADPATSTILGDTVRLTTVLHTNLAYVTPSDLALNLGTLKLHTWGLDPVTSTSPLNATLENWALTGTSWSLASQGLVISQGVVKTGMVDIPFSNLRITPTELTGGNYNLQSLSIKGIIPLTVDGQPYFGYNSGKGHWSLYVLPKPGSTRCASFGGLPGMAPGVKVGVTDFYLLSNGEQRFTIETSPLTLYNVATFNPVNLIAYGDYVHIAGYLDLQIPQVPVAFSAINYSAGNGGPVFSIENFNLQFDGPGVHLSFPPSAQYPKTLGPEGFNAKGTVAEAGKFSFAVNLHHGTDSTAITILPGQDLAISPGGGPRLTQLFGNMRPSGQNWGRLWFAGDLTGAKGASGQLRFNVLGDIVAENQSLVVTNVPGPFGGMSFTFDFASGNLVGFMQINQTLSGGSTISGAANAVIGGSGWYFLCGGQMHLKNPVMDGGALIVFGSHDVTQQMRDLCTQYTYQGKLPASFATRIEGFYSEAMVNIPVIVPSFDFDFLLVSAHLYATVGADMRLGMNFASPANTYYTGMTTWIEAGAGLGSSCVVLCAGLSASARAELDYNGQYQSNGNWYIDGTGSITLTGTAYCGWGVCDSDCDGWFCDKEEESGSVRLGVKGHVGNDGRGIEFFFQ